MASSQHVRKEPELVVFRDPAKRDNINKKSDQISFQKQNQKRLQKSDKVTEKQNATKKFNRKKTDFDFLQAKREVCKLAISSYKGKERRQAIESYLIGLGADPPKIKKCENYKLLTQRKREEKKKKLAENPNVSREEQIRKIITKADNSIKHYNKILRKNKKKMNNQKKRKS